LKCFYSVQNGTKSQLWCYDQAVTQEIHNLNERKQVDKKIEFSIWP